MIVQLLTGVVWLHVNTNCTVLYMIVQLMKCVVMLVHVYTHSIITVQLCITIMCTSNKSKSNKTVHCTNN